MDQKQRMRADARARRAALTSPAFANRIAEFADNLELPQGAVVAGYYPIRDEADPRALMTALSGLGHRLALPCVVAARSALVFRAWTLGDPLVPNAYGIAEPLATAPEVTPDAVLVPLLAFGTDGHRLGYGGGYYDRTFERLPGTHLIGVAYSGQEVAAVPREEHDHPLDAVITEKGLRRFSQA